MIAALDPRTRLTASETADYLGMKKQTLANWRSNGTGPPFYKVGSTVQYLVADLDKWLEAHKVTA